MILRGDSDKHSNSSFSGPFFNEINQKVQKLKQIRLRGKVQVMLMQHSVGISSAKFMPKTIQLPFL